TDSRSRTAGGELRLGTTSTYMGLLYGTKLYYTSTIIINTWVHLEVRKAGNLLANKRLARF
ncbi:MAG: hypothetical protein ACRD22_01515, partial [Terriglobia bacterium]